MNRIEKEMCELIRQEESFVAATILSQSGSTPRLPGTKMIIRKDGSIIGTIGGGLVEAEVMAQAPELLELGGGRIGSFNLDQAGAKDSMDMICGGRMEILMEVITPSVSSERMFEAFLSCVRQGKKGVLAADISGIDEAGGTVRRSFYNGNGSIYGDSDIPRPALENLLAKTGKERSPSLIEEGDGRFLAEPAFSSGNVYLFGAGHVSQQVALLTQMVDFRTIVLDDREEFANPKRFESADEVIVLNRFEDCFKKLSIEEDSYIVILTRGHSHDQTVLEQAIETDAGYIGMIGSSKKRNTIYASMIQKGASEAALRDVYSPIGITIGGETPEEIAVSIVSELIKVRSGK